VKRLPRGRHGLSPEFVAQNQCERLLAALAESLYERGYDETTVAMIGKRAGVSKSDFYKRYESKDACFLAAYDDVVERIREALLAACAEREDWAGGVLDALAALLAFIAAEPARARLVLVEGLRAGKGVYDRYQEALQSFVPYLRDGAPAPAGGTRPPEATDEAVVGGIASLLARRMLAGGIEPLGDFLPEIGEFALTPYLGAAEARRIISER
jgi:AcrR family transcriptional regulator